jgi:L-aminopeptidase/D-esterase-like protein
MDGDTIFGLSTGARSIAVASDGIVRADHSRAAQLNRLFAAAADVFGVACTDAVLTATPVGAAPTYLSVCPSAR